MSDFSSDANRDFLNTSAPPSSGDTENGVDVDAGLGVDGVTNGAAGEVFTPERARMLGALIEKALATPQNYPLSLNALTMACNQTTNRDPIMDMAESQIEQLLSEAKTDGWVRFVHPRSGRGVTKYRQVVDEVLDLSEAEVALVGVLLLRGPQTASELRSRTERMAPMDADTIEEVLASLAQRPAQALVRRLEREPGHREPRWIQLLCSDQGEDRVGQTTMSSPRRAAAAAGAGQADIEALRDELAAVRAELDELRAAFDTFRAEFA